MERLGIFPLEVCGCKTVNFSFQQVNLGVPSVLLVSSYHRSSREKRPDDIFYRLLVFFKFVAFNDREVLQR